MTRVDMQMGGCFGRAKAEEDILVSAERVFPAPKSGLGSDGSHIAQARQQLQSTTRLKREHRN